MNNYLIPKIWFGFNGLLDTSKNETELGRAKTKLFTYSLSTIFEKDLSQQFDEKFPEKEADFIGFEEFEKFINECLLDNAEEKRESDGDVVFRENEKVSLLNSKLSEACWPLCKKFYVTKEVLDLLGNNLCYIFWNIFIISGMTDEYTGKVLLPPMIDVDELTFIFMVLVKQMCFDAGMAKNLKAKIKQQIKEEIRNSTNQNSLSDIECDIDVPIDFTSAVVLLNAIMQDMAINHLTAREVYQDYLDCLQLGIFKQGVILKNKDHSTKGNNSGAKPQLCQIYPGFVVIGTEEKSDEKKVVINLDMETIIESFVVKDKNRLTYRLRVINNKKPVFMLEFNDCKEQVTWLGALNQSVKLKQEGIEYPYLNECGEREKIRREKRQKLKEEKSAWISLSEESNRFKEEALREIKSLKSEASKLERQYEQWNEEREIWMKNKQDVEKSLERKNFELKLLEEQVEKFTKIRERLEVDLCNIHIENLELNQLKEDIAARFDEELRNLELITRQFELYKNETEEKIRDLEKKDYQDGNKDITD